MLAERLTPRVELTIGGARWQVLFTHEVLLDIESLTGCSVLAGQVNLWHSTASVLRAVLYVVLRRAGANYSLQDAGRLLGPARSGEVRRQLQAGWIASMPEPEADDGARGPGRGGGKKRRLASTWMETWGDNREHLRLTDAEWLSMTPRMVQELSRHHLESIRQREYLLSRIGANIVNFGFCHPNPPLPDDVFMPHPWAKPGGKAQTGDDVLRLLADVGWIDEEGRKVIREVLDSED
jgi:hypothetical protein